MKRVWIQEKNIPETFDDFDRLCRDLKNDRVTPSLGMSIRLKLDSNQELSFSKEGSIWFEYKGKDVPQLFLIATEITPAQMWDMVNCLIETKEHKITKLKETERSLFDCGVKQWQFGSKEIAKSFFIEAYEVNKKIKELEGK